MGIGGFLSIAIAAAEQASSDASQESQSFHHSQGSPTNGPTTVPHASTTPASAPPTSSSIASSSPTTPAITTPSSSPSSPSSSLVGQGTSANQKPPVDVPSIASAQSSPEGTAGTVPSSYGQSSAGSPVATQASSTATGISLASSSSSIVVSGSTLVLTTETVAGSISTQTVLVPMTVASGSQSSSPIHSSSYLSRGVGIPGPLSASTGSPKNIETGPSSTSSLFASSTRTPVSEAAHYSPEATILGASIGGGVFVIAVVVASIIYLVKRRNARTGHHGRSASRNESFFAAERPLVSPFPTLSRPQSHATATSMAGTLTDEERWAEYRNVHQSPPLLPNHGLVSRDTLLIDHVVEPLSPPAQRQDMGYAVLSRHSPHSATFPNNEHVIAQTAPQDISYFPEDARSSRADNAPSHAMFFSPPSSLSPASASFSQYIVYDGIEVGSLTDTVTTPNGQRVPVAATNSNSFDGFLPSPSMPSPRRSFASLQSESSSGAVNADETQFGMAI